MYELDEEEKEILSKKNMRSGVEIPSERLSVEYINLFPRSTLCVMYDKPSNTKYYGITMRSKQDIDNPDVGKKVSFVRSMNEMISDIKNDIMISQCT